MEQDLKIAMRAVNEFVKVPLTDYQYAALVSFVFNIGVNAFAGSTLLRLLNQGAYIHVPEQMKRWIYDNGEIVQGLINRRDKEIEMWNGPQVTVAV
jgi:lysozyme